MVTKLTKLKCGDFSLEQTSTGSFELQGMGAHYDDPIPLSDRQVKSLSELFAAAARDLPQDDPWGR